MDSGRCRELVAELCQHVMGVMRKIEACRPDGRGATGRTTEQASGLGLELKDQNGLRLPSPFWLRSQRTAW